MDSLIARLQADEQIRTVSENAGFQYARKPLFRPAIPDPNSLG